MDAQANFWEQTRAAFDSGQLVKLTLSKPRRKAEDQPHQAYARRIELRGSPHWTCVLRYDRRDETRNFAPAEGIEQFTAWLGQDFSNADLFTLEAHLSLQLSRKGKALLRERAARHDSAPPPAHDRPKQRLIAAEKPYLVELGITSTQGKVRSAGRKKFRQINKYVEIIDSLLRDRELPAGAQIFDMGSGKGYLTFALYDHLANELGREVEVTGVELRPELVESSNALAQRMGFTGLRFVAGTIADFPIEQADVLIALHACDTATDDALLRGIQAGAELLIVAPCCQKQVRRDMDPPETVAPPPPRHPAGTPGRNADRRLAGPLPRSPRLPDQGLRVHQYRTYPQEPHDHRHPGRSLRRGPPAHRALESGIRRRPALFGGAAAGGRAVLIVDC